MNELHELLDDAVREPSQAVRVDPMLAWASGRRRRVRRRVALTSAIAIALLFFLSLAPALSLVSGVPLPASSSGDHNPVTSHPQRLDYDYFDRTLPNTSGPLAGLIERNDEDVAGWYAVSPSGRLWRVPSLWDDVPALAPDGTHLAYMHGNDPANATYRIVDQMSGEVTEFDDISVGVGSDKSHRWFHQGQMPSYWSPDSSRVILQIGNQRRNDPLPDPAAFVLDNDGSVTRIDAPDGADSGFPLGWIDRDHVAIYASHGDNEAVSVRIWIVAVESGETVRSFALDDMRTDYPFGQWLGAISPDGTTLAALTVSADQPQLRLHPMNGADAGSVDSQNAVVPDASDTCLPVWSASTPYIAAMTSPSRNGTPGESAVLIAANGTTPIIADPRLGIVCSAWATDALDGPIQNSLGSRLFGQRSTWLSWHWREVALAVLLAAALSGGLLGARLLGRRAYLSRLTRSRGRARG